MTAAFPRRGLVFASDALEALPKLATDAERAGFRRIWTTDYPGRDALSRAVLVAEATDVVGVGSGIAYAFNRSPVAMAAAAADIQRISGGRFALGLGSGTKGVRRWYGVEFEPPATRLAAYATEVRDALSAAAELSAVGPPEVLGAGLRPAMLGAVARSCDGVLLHPLGLVRRHLQDRVLPALERGRARAVAAWCITAVSEDRERAVANARRQIAFYLSTPSYAPVLAGTSWEAAAERIREDARATGRATDWAALEALVPDELLDELALAGTPADVAGQAARLESELSAVGIDELAFQSVGAGLSEAEAVSSCMEIVGALGVASVENARSQMQLGGTW